MQRSKSTFHLPTVVIGIVTMLIIMWVVVSGALDTIPAWKLAAGAVVLVGAFFSVFMLLESRRTRDLVLIAQELGLKFSKRIDEASLQPFFANPTPVDVRAFGDALPDLSAHPEMARMLQQAIGKAQSSKEIHHSELRQLGLFQGVQHTTGKNGMSGQLGRGHALVFEYSYYTPGPTEHSTSATQTVAAFRFPGKELPAFEVSPEGIFQKMASGLGAQDVNFDGHPEFSKRFRLRCKDENAVRGFFGPGVLRAFEALDRGFDQIVEGAGDCVVVYRPGKRVGVGEIKAFIQDASAIASRLGAGS